MQNEVFGVETNRKSQLGGAAGAPFGTEVLDVPRRSNPYNFPSPSSAPLNVEMAQYNPSNGYYNAG